MHTAKDGHDQPPPRRWTGHPLLQQDSDLERLYQKVTADPKYYLQSCVQKYVDKIEQIQVLQDDPLISQMLVGSQKDSMSMPNEPNKSSVERGIHRRMLKQDKVRLLDSPSRLHDDPPQPFSYSPVLQNKDTKEQIRTLYSHQHQSRNNKFCVFDALNLDQIIWKIYFEGYSYDSIKEYMFPALRKVPSADQFEDSVVAVLRHFSRAIKTNIAQEILDIVSNPRPPEPLHNTSFKLIAKVYSDINRASLDIKANHSPPPLTNHSPPSLTNHSPPPLTNHSPPPLTNHSPPSLTNHSSSPLSIPSAPPLEDSLPALIQEHLAKPQQFRKHCAQLNMMIDQFYHLQKMIDVSNFEVNKIVKLYNDHFLDQKSPSPRPPFDASYLKRLFMRHIYDDKGINDFVLYMCRHYNDKASLAKKYPDIKLYLDEFDSLYRQMRGDPDHTKDQEQDNKRRRRKKKGKKQKEEPRKQEDKVENAPPPVDTPPPGVQKVKPNITEEWLQNLKLMTEQKLKELRKSYI